MGPQAQAMPEKARRARALEMLVDLNVLANLGRKAGLDKSEEIKFQLKLMEAEAVGNAYSLDRINKIRPTVTDEMLKARYDKEASEQEVKARHILVKTEDEAKAIIKELEGGADFVELAKKKSVGPSGPQGGDCLLYTSPSPRDKRQSRMPSSA